MARPNQSQVYWRRVLRASIVLSMLLSACSAFAGTGSLAGSKEISLSGQMGQVTTTEEYTYHSLFGSWSSSDKSTSTYMTLALRFGLYVYQGLAIEPEVHWTSWENVEPALSLHGNIAYNFNLKQAPGKPRVIPFLLAGYGIGNAVPFYYSYIWPASDEWDVTVLNLGAGTKVFVTEWAALRTEYRFQRYAYDEETAYSTTKTTHSFHNVFFGFSVFLPPGGRHESR
jgi:opacity protein-like surface antigen